MIGQGLFHGFSRIFPFCREARADGLWNSVPPAACGLCGNSWGPKAAICKFFSTFESKIYMHMDLDRLQSDLRRLAEIVGSWDASKEIDALERDLVLEKLRGLYETVRFGVRSETVPAEPAAAEPALPIDLGEVLSSPCRRRRPLLRSPFPSSRNRPRTPGRRFRRLPLPNLSVKRSSPKSRLHPLCLPQRCPVPNRSRFPNR